MGRLRFAARRLLGATGLLLATHATARGGPPAVPAPSGTPSIQRVELDRLKWAPDGGALAVEARWCHPGGTSDADTLLIDLRVGASAPLAPRPLAFAIHEPSRRLAVADRYALWVGPIDRPEALTPLVRLDAGSGQPVRLGWNSAGDSLLLAVRAPAGDELDFARFALSEGVRVSLGRRPGGREGDLYWRGLGAVEALLVEQNPFPGLYQSIGDNLFFLERTERETPGVRGQWFFDLHHRNQFDGSERILARLMAPEAALLSPDSMWLAVTGREYRADYGGSVRRTLWLASPDGQEFFSVQPSGVREVREVAVSALTWYEGRLWYLGDDGLYVVPPGAGRSLPVRLAPPIPVWARTLPGPARVLTCRLPDSHADSSTALTQCDRLRREGWPAWVAGPIGGPYRVAVGAAADEATLRTILTSQRGGAELLRDFPPEWVAAVAEGTTLPYGVTRSPGHDREAWLSAVGPPGARAGELWLTEDHGARRIRLLRARWFQRPDAPEPAAPRVR